MASRSEGLESSRHQQRRSCPDCHSNLGIPELTAAHGAASHHLNFDSGAPASPDCNTGDALQKNKALSET